MGKLEGPSKHHHNHGNRASVPMKGNGRAIPGQHWEKHYNLNGCSKLMEDTGGSDFDPKQSSHRKTTYEKVNEEDH